MRKGDLVHITVGTLNAYYYVIGIRHDADTRSMTLDLHVPYKEYEKKVQVVEKKTTMWAIPYGLKAALIT